jgi:hypothetical protein
MANACVLGVGREIGSKRDVTFWSVTCYCSDTQIINKIAFHILILIHHSLPHPPFLPHLLSPDEFFQLFIVSSPFSDSLKIPLLAFCIICVLP